jgi:hypothetical protein
VAVWFLQTEESSGHLMSLPPSRPKPTVMISMPLLLADVAAVSAS